MGKKAPPEEDWEIDDFNEPTPDKDGVPPWEDVYEQRKEKRARKNNRRMGSKVPARRLSEAE